MGAPLHEFHRVRAPWGWELYLGRKVCAEMFSAVSSPSRPGEECCPCSSCKFSFFCCKLPQSIFYSSHSDVKSHCSQPSDRSLPLCGDRGDLGSFSQGLYLMCFLRDPQISGPLRGGVLSFCCLPNPTHKRRQCVGNKAITFPA